MKKILMCLLFSITTLVQSAVPELKEPVNDYVGVLKDLSSVNNLNQRLKKLNDTGKVQMAILVINSLHGEVISQYSMKVAESWKLGSKEQDNGLLFVMSIQERKMRLEVGQGLEGSITDLQSKRIVDSLSPFFKNNQYELGLSHLVDQIEGIVNVAVPNQGLLENQLQQKITEEIKYNNTVNFLIILGSIIIAIVLLLFCIIENNWVKNEFLENKKYYEKLGLDIDKINYEELMNMADDFKGKHWSFNLEGYVNIVKKYENSYIISVLVPNLRKAQENAKLSKQKKDEYDESLSKTLNEYKEELEKVKERVSNAKDKVDRYKKTGNITLLSEDTDYIDLIEAYEEIK